MGTPVKRLWWLVCLASLSSATIAEELPSLEMLEFLSSWQDEDGESLDPDMFDDPIERVDDPRTGDGHVSD